MPFNNAKKQLKNVIKLLDDNIFTKNEKDNIYTILSNPNKVHKFELKIKMDNWMVKSFTAFRSQHNNLKGPYKGWIRFHQDVSENEVKALSTWMTIKTSVLDLPLWGWKGWIIVNPKDLSKNELKKLSEEYVKFLYKEIGPDVDVPAPDVNTNWQIMAWMNNKYQELVWKDVFTFTWKPLELGWSLWRPEATWFGWITVLEEVVWNLKKKKVIIQGFWNVGSFAAKRLLSKWAIILWISDSKSAIYKEEWFSKEEIEYFIKIKSCKKFSLEEIKKSLSMEWVIVISNEELLTKKCDILIPSALENVITEKNANNINANYILELANWPVTPEADEILEKRNIIVIPDVLANSGWVLVSYYEQIQNKSWDYWDKDFVINKMDKKLKLETNNILDLKIKNLRLAAYLLSVTRLWKIAKLKNLI